MTPQTITRVLLHVRDLAPERVKEAAALLGGHADPEDGAQAFAEHTQGHKPAGTHEGGQFTSGSGSTSAAKSNSPVQQAVRALRARMPGVTALVQAIDFNVGRPDVLKARPEKMIEPDNADVAIDIEAALGKEWEAAGKISDAMAQVVSQAQDALETLPDSAKKEKLLKHAARVAQKVEDAFGSIADFHQEAIDSLRTWEEARQDGDPEAATRAWQEFRHDFGNYQTEAGALATLAISDREKLEKGLRSVLKQPTAVEKHAEHTRGRHKPGDVWKGQSGQWFTMQPSHHVVPTNDPTKHDQQKRLRSRMQPVAAAKAIGGTLGRIKRQVAAGILRAAGYDPAGQDPVARRQFRRVAQAVGAVAHALESAAMVVFSKSNQIAREVSEAKCRAKGLSPEDTERITKRTASILKAVDLGLAWTVNMPATLAVTGSLGAAKASSWVPVAGLAYLAAHPVRAWAAAVKVLGGDVGKAADAIAEHGTRLEGRLMRLSGVAKHAEDAPAGHDPTAVAALVDLLADADDPDWAQALVAAALDEHGYDLAKAVAAVGKALRAHPHEPGEWHEAHAEDAQGHQHKGPGEGGGQFTAGSGGGGASAEEPASHFERHHAHADALYDLHENMVPVGTDDDEEGHVAQAYQRIEAPAIELKHGEADPAAVQERYDHLQEAAEGARDLLAAGDADDEHRERAKGILAHALAARQALRQHVRERQSQWEERDGGREERRASLGDAEKTLLDGNISGGVIKAMRDSEPDVEAYRATTSPWQDAMYTVADALPEKGKAKFVKKLDAVVKKVDAKILAWNKVADREVAAKEALDAFDEDEPVDDQPPEPNYPDEPDAEFPDEPDRPEPKQEAWQAEVDRIDAEYEAAQQQATDDYEKDHERWQAKLDKLSDAVDKWAEKRQEAHDAIVGAFSDGDSELTDLGAELISDEEDKINDDEADDPQPDESELDLEEGEEDAPAKHAEQSHKPAGTPEGGQFTSRGTGSGRGAKYGLVTRAGTPNAQPESQSPSHSTLEQNRIESRKQEPDKKVKPKGRGKKVVEDHPEAARIAEESHARHLQRTKGMTDPLEHQASYDQHKAELEAAGVVPTATGYGFRTEKHAQDAERFDEDFERAHPRAEAGKWAAVASHPLFSQPGGVHVSRLARETKVPQKALKAHLDDLVGRGKAKHHGGGVYQSQDAAPEVAPPAEPVPATDREAARALAPLLVKGHGQASFADLRAATGWSVKDLHQVLRKLQADGVVALSAIEGRYGVAPEQREASIVETGVGTGGERRLGFASVKDDEKFRRLLTRES